jgi:hypothetical protein
MERSVRIAGGGGIARESHPADGEEPWRWADDGLVVACAVIAAPWAARRPLVLRLRFERCFVAARGFISCASTALRGTPTPRNSAAWRQRPAETPAGPLLSCSR